MNTFNIVRYQLKKDAIYFYVGTIIIIIFFLFYTTDKQLQSLPPTLNLGLYLSVVATIKNQRANDLGHGCIFLQGIIIEAQQNARKCPHTIVSLIMLKTQ